jgi:Protein of unknown function (DUF3617)
MRRPEEAADSLRSGRTAARPQPVLRRGGLGCIVVVLAGTLLAGGPARGDEFPQRKPGLWEMRTSGGPVGSQSLQQCIDAATDDILRRQSSEGQNCSKPVVERDGNRYRVSSTCDGSGTRTTMDGVYTMVNDIEYRGDMKMTFDPPLSGATEMNMKMTGKWLGACKPGMKPGDIVMQGVPRLNALEMGKDGGGITPEQARRMSEEMHRNMDGGPAPGRR